MAESLSLSSSPESPGAARRFVSSHLQQWGYPRLVPTAELVTSELATNAVEHSGRTFTVALEDLGHGVHIAVGDSADRLPVQRDSSPVDVSGRGMQIVDALSDAWGTTPVPDDGKLVWCDLHDPGRLQL